MKSINTYYDDFQTLQAFLSEHTIEDSPSLLIQVFTSKNDKSFIQTLLNELTTVLPQASIIGSTTDGEIMNAEVSTHKTVLSFTQFKYTQLKTDIVMHKKDGYFSGQSLARSLIQDDTKLLIAFVDGLSSNGEAFLDGIHSVNSDVMVAGGLAGDNATFTQTYVFTRDHIIAKGAVAVSLSSNHLTVSNGYSFNWHRIGKELTITKAVDNRVYTINNKTAVDIYTYYLGKDTATGLPATGIEFPLIFTRNGIRIARAVLTKHDDGSLVFAGNLHTGDKVQFGYGNPLDILGHSDDIFDKIQEKPSETIFIYSCMARRRFMPDTIHEEIKPLQSIAPTSGFFTYGEFYTGDRKELLNQSMTIVSLSEKNSVTIPRVDLSPQKATTTSSINALIHLVNRTSQEVMEQELEDEYILIKERINLALEGSETSILDWDLTTNDFYISPSWKERLGYSDSELKNIPATWLNQVHPEDKKVVLSSIIEHAKNRIQYYENIHRLKHKDGHWIWILGRAQIIYDKNGKKLRMIGTHTDITEEKELQLKYSQQVQVMEQIHDGIIATNLEGNIVSWNMGAEKLFGYDQSEVIGKHISLIYRKEDIPILKEHIRASLSETSLYAGDLVFVKKSKETISVALSLSTLKDEKGNAIGMIGINQDITQRKKSETALYEAKQKAEESAKSKSVFLANMSHEIRTPMNAILGFVELLKKEHIGSVSKQYVDIIDSSSKGLLKIIEDILDFSKIESGKLDIDKVDFNIKEEFEIITHIFLAKCSENDIELSLDLDKNLPKSINTDPLRVKQVIFNLLSNAIKFTEKGKKIIVDINYKDDFLNVSVKDEGKGIAKDKLSHIFESFSQEDSSTTREYGGTGLGLTISHALVKLLGGELKVKSEIGVGSEFYFSIRAVVGKEIKDTEEILENITFDNKKILLVEDVQTSQMFMSIVLEGLHFEVDIANDGVEAVEAFKQNRYDVILMDENMPNLNGMGATKQILEIEAQNNLPHTPIVALTANAIKGDRERFLNAGMDEYLTKPIDRNQLAKTLKKVLVEKNNITV